MPGKLGSPAASRARRLSRTSALTVLWTWPLSRSAERVVMFGWLTPSRYVGKPDPSCCLLVGRFGDGIGVSADLVEAAETAVAAALAPLHGRTPDLALVFVSGPDA